MIPTACVVSRSSALAEISCRVPPGGLNKHLLNRILPNKLATATTEISVLYNCIKPGDATITLTIPFAMFEPVRHRC